MGRGGYFPFNRKECMQEKIRANGYEMPNAICLVIHYHTLWYLLSLSQQRCQGISLTSEKDRGMGWGDCILFLLHSEFNCWGTWSNTGGYECLQTVNKDVFICFGNKSDIL